MARYLRENLATLEDRPDDAFKPVVLEDGSEHGPEDLAALGFLQDALQDQDWGLAQNEATRILSKRGVESADPARRASHQHRGNSERTWRTARSSGGLYWLGSDDVKRGAGATAQPDINLVLQRAGSCDNAMSAKWTRPIMRDSPVSNSLREAMTCISAAIADHARSAL